MDWMFLVSSYQKVRWYKKLDIPLKICYSVIVRLREKEFLMIGAPPSVGGGGPARPPRERNFYKKTNRNSKLLFFNPIERNIMEKIEYVNRMRYATDPELEYYHYDEDYDFEVESPMVILREASGEHGERFASQLEGVADSHFPCLLYTSDAADE